MLLPDTGIEDAIAAADTIRNAILELGLKHRDSPDGIVKISAGVEVCIPIGGVDGPTRLIRATDKALYEAKYE